MSRHHHHTSLNARRWAAVRRAAFERDGYRCTRCGKAGRLEAHHNPPLRAGADPYDVAGIATICRACHIALHRPDNMVAGRMEWHDFVKTIMSEPPLS